jgi:tetratricopeptide (TPR) repeat protein
MLKPSTLHRYTMAFLKSAERHTKEGVKHLQERNFEKALKSFKNAEKKKPEDPVIMDYLSQVYAAMNDLDKATEYILKAITVEPQSPIHKQLYATYLMRQEKNDEAIAVIDEVLEIQPVGIMYVLRGQADFNLENFDSAMTYFNKALELDPKNPLANHMKGLLLYRQQSYSEAIPYLEVALSFGEIESLKFILEDCRAKSSE